MSRALYQFSLLVSIALTTAEDPELPPCPTNIQFFPQTLPMHCRLVVSPNGDIPGNPTPPKPTLPPLPKIPSMTFPPSFFQSPPPDKVQAMPFPIPPPYPPFPGPMPMPMPMPMPLPVQPPPHKLPVIVMPFYTPSKNTKKESDSDRGRRPGYRPGYRPGQRPRYYSSETDSSNDFSSDTDNNDDTDTDSSDIDTWRKSFRRSFRSKKHKRRKHQKKKNRELLTPIIQYVTKDGYVIYEKEISKAEAKGWLSNKKEEDSDPNKATYAELDDLNKEIPGDGTDVEELETRVSKEITTQRPPVRQRVHKHSKKNMNKPLGHPNGIIKQS